MSDESNETVEEPVSDTSETPEVEEATADVSDTSETPEAEATPAAEEVSDTPETPEVEAKPARSRRHVPRAQRRQRTKVAREQAKTRKPITRTEKPEAERGRRQERRGVVVSAAMDKTIVVKVEAARAHPKYKKVIRRSVKFHAHDEANQAKVGDVVRIVETRKLSKTKNWRLAEVLEVAK
jgi:small subunit ribosomal protein S17